jgi:hypothetical protein
MLTKLSTRRFYPKLSHKFTFGPCQSNKITALHESCRLYCALNFVKKLWLCCIYSPFADHGTSNNNTCALYSIGYLFYSQLGHQLDGLSFSVPIGALLHDHFHTKYTSHQSSFQWRPVRLQELRFWIPLIWSSIQMPEYPLLTRLLR